MDGGTGGDDAQKLQAGILARTALVMHQTVNLGRGPEWIQALSVDELRAASDRLYRVSRRHENKAVLPMIFPWAVGVGVAAAFFAAIQYAHAPINTADRVTVLVISFLLSFCAWMPFYDIRRRHRHVVTAAEKRWAEVTVELALREDPAKTQGETHVER